MLEKVIQGLILQGRVGAGGWGLETVNVMKR